jgi:hypothetical protein
MVEKTASRQPRFVEKREDIVPWVFTAWETSEDIPEYGSPSRTRKLREFARSEPILSGALASMVSKVVSLEWQISGGRNRTLRFQEMLAHEVEGGGGWSLLVDRWAQDYLNTDLGGVLEIGREARNGPVVGLYNLDSEALWLTGSAEFPLRYTPKVGGVVTLGTKTVPLRPTDFVRIVDMPSPDESLHGLGFCSVSRAIKAAKVLLALYNYEDERLSDMPLPGLVTVTGMTMGEVKNAFALYDATRKSREQYTFKNVLWLAATASPVNPIQVNLVPFSSLPEAFDKMTTVSLYVYTLSLDFGVDVREFWPASQTGATKGEAEVQAQKAKGKGFGRMLSAMERAINWYVLPEGLEFRFDNRDSEEDMLRELIHAQAVTSIRKLWEPAAASGAGIITTDEARRLLVEDSILPDWVSWTDDTTVSGQSNTDDVDRIVKSVQDARNSRLIAKARAAGLAPGEDYVVINKNGDVTALWRDRSYYTVDNWPVRKEALKDGVQVEQGQEEAQALKEHMAFLKAAAEHRRAATILEGCGE